MVLIDVADLLDDIGVSDQVIGDYSPFPSKAFFLLFTLLNSPRPLVSSKVSVMEDVISNITGAVNHQHYLLHASSGCS